MNCPSTDALIALAIGAPTPANRDHITGCPACAARLSEIRSVLDRLEAHATPDRGHEAGRVRLLAALAAEPGPVRPSFVRRVLMDRRTWASSAAAAALVVAAVLLGWGGSSPVALADALQPFKEAKSFACELIPLQDGKPSPEAEKVTVRIIWAAPGSLRCEFSSKPDGRLGETVIIPHGKAGINLDHRRKTYRPTSQPAAAEAVMLKLIHGLAAQPDGDQKPAGTDMIGTVKAPRFDLKLSVPEAKGMAWHAHVWVDPKTKQPLRVEFALQPGKNPADKGVTAIRLDKFEWNTKVDGLFDTEPPAGYESASGAREKKEK